MKLFNKKNVFKYLFIIGILFNLAIIAGYLIALYTYDMPSDVLAKKVYHQLMTRMP